MGNRFPLVSDPSGLRKVSYESPQSRESRHTRRFTFTAALHHGARPRRSTTALNHCASPHRGECRVALLNLITISYLMTTTFLPIIGLATKFGMALCKYGTYTTI
ncbi:hypothetical protein Ddc_22156 [Ditylenchus destructor]|nr:hypothetical protein Ddc_22156 [Ditylenchus destructor]